MLVNVPTLLLLIILAALVYGVWLLLQRAPLAAVERRRRADVWTRGSVVGDSYATAAAGAALGTLVVSEAVAAGGTSSCGGGSGASGAGCGGSGGGCGGAGCGSGSCGGSGCGSGGCGGSGCGGGGCGGS